MNNTPESDLRELNENIKKLNKSMSSYGITFAKGLLTGLGSVLGAGIAIILIGWFLNIIGVIPAFQKQAEQWRQVFIQSQNNQTYVTPDNNSTASPTEQP